MRRSRNVGAALIGLLVVAAISLAAGSGRKPPKEAQTTASLRRISGSEVMAFIDKFPGMIPARFASARSDTEFLKGLFQFSELTAPALTRAFPMARFYQGIDISETPGSPYVMAITGNERYMMPGGFNQLLLGSGLEVTDKNIVELAEAFVVMVIVGERYSLPEVTFLEAKRSKQVVNTVHFDEKLTVKIGEQTEEWYFEIWRSQFREVFRMNGDKFIKGYQLGVNQLQEHGRLDNWPRIDIDTAPRSAYVEHDTAQKPHYYATVDTNGHSTHR